MTTKIKSGVIAAGAVDASALSDNSITIAHLNCSDGTNGQVLSTDGSGTLSFTDMTGGVDGIVSSADATAITIDSAENVEFVNNIRFTNDKFIYSYNGGATTGEVRAGFKFDGTNEVVSAYTNQLERMRIDSSGNVGIGEISPDESLVVNGGVKIKSTNKLSFSNTSDQTYIHAVGSNLLAFGTDSTERMRIDSSGDITMSGTGSVKIPSGTTAQRPSSPTAGMVRYNTTESYVEYYNGSAWFPTSETGVDASGGTETTVGGYKIHTFTTSGTLTVTSGGDVEYLVIAGGGGGGCGTAGGGGAGGYRTNVSGETSGGGASAESSLNLSTGSYTIIVGAGGAGGVVSTSNVSNGSNSIFGSITSIGGGAGGEGNTNNTRAAGQSGGSGGGDWSYGGDSETNGSGTSGQGYDGGTGANDGGSGGGGAGAVGGSGSNSSKGGDGGNGVSSSITGSAVVRGGGGGGAGYPDASSGGTGGGGGSWYSNYTQSGTANTGGGGAGDYAYASGNGGNGGSGIVIIRYAV